MRQRQCVGPERALELQHGRILVGQHDRRAALAEKPADGLAIPPAAPVTMATLP